ncbi:matrilin-3-like [Haliotis asinina]|uniref:matrilin-3-like n=1 Tax=Haliotis asinina TaxID=109174 RepID=UPI003531FEF5
MGKVVFILLLLPVGCFCYHPYTTSPRNPCDHFTELKNISSRSLNVSGDPVVNNDVNLASAWYAAPAGWELLSHDPGSWKTCGTEKPIYRTGKGTGTSTMCVRSESAPCVYTFPIDTEICGTREVFKLRTDIVTSGFCFSCIGRKLDILIITDVSRSIGPRTFEKMRQFQLSLLDSIDISQDTDAVALMEFAETPSMLLTLDSPSSVKKANVLSTINKQQYENGPSTDLADALDMAVTEVFTAQTGDRADADNMVILFTDAWLYKSEEEDVVTAIGQLSRKAEVLVVASKGENSAVRKIASEPKDDHIFLLDGTDAVEQLRKTVKPCPLIT